MVGVRAAAQLRHILWQFQAKKELYVARIWNMIGDERRHGVVVIVFVWEIKSRISLHLDVLKTGPSGQLGTTGLLEPLRRTPRNSRWPSQVIQVGNGRTRRMCSVAKLPMDDACLIAALPHTCVLFLTILHSSSSAFAIKRNRWTAVMVLPTEKRAKTSISMAG